LLTEKQKFDNLFELSTTLLKYQMGMPIGDQLKLTDKIGMYKTLAIEANTQAQFSNRPEYGMLQAQKKLYELDLKSNRAGYLPTLAAFGNVGYNSGNFTVGKLYSEKWYPYSNLGLALKVPIFDGFQKAYKSQQSKLNLEKTNQSISTLENTINLQVKVAEINLKNSTQSLENQQHNIKLAEEVAKGSEYKYKMGVGSNLEVVTAESALKEAQINYYNALYDVLVYKVDMDFALGNLK
jgi:outer membrane protein TolC